jgi:hypothetical protein
VPKHSECFYTQDSDCFDTHCCGGLAVSRRPVHSVISHVSIFPAASLNIANCDLVACCQDGDRNPISALTSLLWMATNPSSARQPVPRCGKRVVLTTCCDNTLSCINVSAKFLSTSPVLLHMNTATVRMETSDCYDNMVCNQEYDGRKVCRPVPQGGSFCQECRHRTLSSGLRGMPFPPVGDRGHVSGC